jgi:hypothetical protein
MGLEPLERLEKGDKTPVAESVGRVFALDGDVDDAVARHESWGEETRSAERRDGGKARLEIRLASY